MRKIYLALAGCGLAMATPAVAETILPVGSFNNYGACVSKLAWFANSQRWGTLDGWGRIKDYAGQDLYCSKYGDKWYIVLGDDS